MTQHARIRRVDLILRSMGIRESAHALVRENMAETACYWQKLPQNPHCDLSAPPLQERVKGGHDDGDGDHNTMEMAIEAATYDASDATMSAT